MSQLGYRHGNTIVHRFDVRLKILYLAVFSLISVHISWIGLLVLTMVIVAAVSVVRLSIVSLFRDFRYLGVLMIFVLAARSLSIPDHAFWRIDRLVFSHSGFMDGTIYCWRLTLITLMGVVMLASTRSSEIRAGIQWMLKPVPFIPEKKVGMMMGLIVRFIPVILNQVMETGQALRARGIEGRRNPFHRMAILGPPLLRRTFLQADRLVLAMEARCYTEHRTERPLSTTRLDWIGLVGLLGLSGMLLFVA